MSIDARIPMMAGQAATVNLAQMYQQKQQMDMQRQQMEMQREEMEFRKAVQATNLDENKRKAMQEGIKDIASAVQWADTPEKWAQVQQHYGQYDPQLSSVPFEQRESALVKLGKLGDYLEATKPDIRTVEPGGSVVGIAPGGQVTEYVRANPGGAAPYSPVDGDIPTVSSPDEAKRLPPGSQFRTPDGRVMRVPGGPTQSASGGF